MEITRGIKWVYSRKTGEWEIFKDSAVENISLTPSTLPSSKAGSWREGPSGGRRGGGGRGNANWVGNSDEPSLPPFPN
jgi:hypothetical protein